MDRAGKRRAWFWVAVLVTVAACAGGATIAYLGYRETAGPAGAVRGYFAALARSDAAGALAFGDVPDGTHTLLTVAVLREQQRIAPLRHFSVASTRTTGSTARVEVHYTLAFHGEDLPVTARVRVHKSHDGWRLDSVAIPTELEPNGARQRESILGTRIPSGEVLLFPGAIPVRFDTPYLELEPSQSAVSFDALPTTNIDVQVTDAARSAMLAAVRAGLASCLTDAHQYACPLPSERYVPGSVHGRIKGDMRTTTVELDSLNPVGRIEFTATVTIAGSYRRLDFHNRQVHGHGDFSLDVKAVAYAVAPLTTTWTSP